jgi:hypothetical protein
MKYGFLVVFIRHDFAEIWGFRYRLTLGIGILLQIMASNSVFECLICALKNTISCDARVSSMNLN